MDSPYFVFQKLFTIIFKNWLEKDAAEALRSLRSLSGEQHRLNTSNFLYMRPDCRTVDLKFAAKQQQMGHQVGNQYVQSFISLKHKQSFEIEQKVALKLFVRRYNLYFHPTIPLNLRAELLIYVNKDALLAL